MLRCNNHNPGQPGLVLRRQLTNLSPGELGKLKSGIHLQSTALSIMFCP